MLQDLQILSAVRHPDPHVVFLATCLQVGLLMLLLGLVVYVVLLFRFVRQLTLQEPAVWQAAGRPTLLKHSNKLIALYSARQRLELPQSMQRLAAFLSYVTWGGVILFLGLLVLYGMIYFSS